MHSKAIVDALPVCFFGGARTRSIRLNNEPPFAATASRGAMSPLAGKLMMPLTNHQESSVDRAPASTPLRAVTLFVVVPLWLLPTENHDSFGCQQPPGDVELVQFAADVKPSLKGTVCETNLASCSPVAFPICVLQN